jgi:hypothetical protein
MLLSAAGVPFPMLLLLPPLLYPLLNPPLLYPLLSQLLPPLPL